MSPRRPTHRARRALATAGIVATITLAVASWGARPRSVYGQDQDAGEAVPTALDDSSGRLPAAILPEERPGYPGWTYRVRRRMMLGGQVVDLFLRQPAADNGGETSLLDQQPAADNDGETSLLDLASGLFANQISQTLRVLLLGSDKREGDTVWRTDTIILASLDPQSRQVRLVSLPRDLWVFIPGHGYGRLNTADYLGHLDRQGEAELVRRTIGANLGVGIDRYVLVDMAAFIALVDALGGLDLPVDCPIEDRLLENGPGETGDVPLAEGPVNERVLDLDTGLHHLDGRGVLAYARTRTGSSDLVRTRHQQRVLRALMQKARGGRMAARLPQLWQAMQGRVRTDLALGELIYGASVASGLSADDLHTRVLGPADLNDWTTPDGQQVLVLTPRGKAAVAAALGAEDPAVEDGGAAAELAAKPLTAAIGGPLALDGDLYGSGPDGFDPSSGVIPDLEVVAPTALPPFAGQGLTADPTAPSDPLAAAGLVFVRDDSGHGDWGEVAAVRLQEAGLEVRVHPARSEATGVETHVLYTRGHRDLAAEAAAALAIPLAAVREATADGERPMPGVERVLAVIGADWRSCPGGRGH